VTLLPLTPNIDELASNGTIFTRPIVSKPEVILLDYPILKDTTDQKPRSQSGQSISGKNIFPIIDILLLHIFKVNGSI